MQIYSQDEIEKIFQASQIAAQALSSLYGKIVPGISTQQINDWLQSFIESKGAFCACIGYKGFPKACCTSVNQVVCHGIPSSSMILREGNIINVDVVVLKDGYHGDTSRMFYVGKVNIRDKALVENTYLAMMAGIEAIQIGQPTNIIGEAIENYINSLDIKYGIVENYCGHGLGKKMHESPSIFHYKTPKYKGHIIQPGMCFTVEPMINAGSKEVRTLADEWTVVTKDRSMSAQWEHTIAITDTGYRILSIDENYKTPFQY